MTPSIPEQAVLLTELREHERNYASLIHGPLCGRAADEIERLTAAAPLPGAEEIARIEKLLSEIAPGVGPGEWRNHEHHLVGNTFQEQLKSEGKYRFCSICRCYPEQKTAKHWTPDIKAIFSFRPALLGTVGREEIARAVLKSYGHPDSFAEQQIAGNWRIWRDALNIADSIIPILSLRPALPAPATRDYVEQKRCCTVCDRKKVCHVCGDQTLLACSDCAINFGATIYVCQKSECRDEHERKCFGSKALPAPAGWQETIQRCAKVIDDMRVSEAGLFDAEHSGSRGEARSIALYDAYQAVMKLTAAPAPAEPKEG